MTPIADLARLVRSTGQELTVLGGTTAHTLTSSGRSALVLALRQVGLQTGDEVMIPAYHCLAVRAAVRSIGALPVTYKVTPMLRCDIDDITRRITERTKCVVIIHYFGFPQDLSELDKLCRDRGIRLVEDCAHALYTQGAASRVGRIGDYAVGSLMKFLPTFDGGFLLSYRHPVPDQHLVTKGLLFELKAISRVVDLYARWNNRRYLSAAVSIPTHIAATLKSLHPRIGRTLLDVTPTTAYGSLDLDMNWLRVRPAFVSRLLWKVTDHVHVVKTRRRLFETYLAELGDVVGGRPLFCYVPDGVVPYIFPFVLDDPEIAFNSLRSAGVPMYRWEDCDASGCGVSTAYSRSLVQFPCHQALSDSDVKRLCVTVRRVLAEIHPPKVGC